MRFLQLGLLCASLLSHPALAQTTFTGGCPAGTGFTVSPDGLTVTATSAAGGGRCQANTVKYNGQWYYTVTPTVVGWSGGYGVAAAGWAASVYNDVGIGDDLRSAGYQITSAGSPANQVGYGINREKNINGVNYVSGKTIGIVINQDTNPWQMWVTPDISNRSGCGGGPVWNGDTTTYAAPVRFTSGAHSPCGGPGTGGTVFTGPTSNETGLPWQVAVGASPGMTGQYYGAQNTVVTFSFGPNATLDALIGASGPGPIYKNWNVDGGDGGTPGPNHPQTRNVANAPVWQPSTTYTSFPNDDRVLAGPGYSPPSSFSPASYVAYGDSITLGNSASFAYPTHIAADKSLTLTNYGVNGQQTAGMVIGLIQNENRGATGNPITRS